jgi:predicted unusual protein kinase regulating ubiquinone biosynthesis (AarF/ABC1/UbiB family)
MGYMRGAVMKVGQTLASFPDVVPKEYADTLESLHFQAPPMHFSLLRELFLNEFGQEPETLFAEFDETAFAAASLGQVHRAKLKTGETVAVKIQYPGIARTIRTDFKNLIPMLLPVRLSKDWDNLKSQLEFLRRSLEQETDYEREANFLTRARKLFYEEEGIVVPKVHPEYSTGKVLTMEYLPGVHLAEYLKANPSQEERNESARKIMRGTARILYRERIQNVDCHPGNYLFMPDGRVGLIDFGCMLTYESAEDWACIARMSKGITTGAESDIRGAMREWGQFGDVPDDDERLDAFVRFAKNCWKPYHQPGPFDYGDKEHLQEGIDIFAEMAGKRYVRSYHTNLMNFRWESSQRMLMYRLAAVVDPKPIMEEEIAATGWNRDDWVRPGERGASAP